MALVEIFTDNSLSAFQEEVQLDGTPYILQLYFNPRINDGVGKWMISISDQNSNLLVGPVPLVVSWPLFDRFVDLITLPGTLFAFDTSGQDIDPGQFELGARVRLFYLEAGSTL